MQKAQLRQWKTSEGLGENKHKWHFSKNLCSNYNPNLNKETKQPNFKTSFLCDFSWRFTQKCLTPDKQPQTKETPPNPCPAWWTNEFIRVPSKNKGDPPNSYMMQKPIPDCSYTPTAALCHTWRQEELWLESWGWVSWPSLISWGPCASSHSNCNLFIFFIFNLFGGGGACMVHLWKSEDSLNSSHPAWRQVPLPTKPAHQSQVLWFQDSIRHTCQAWR